MSRARLPLPLCGIFRDPALSDPSALLDDVNARRRRKRSRVRALRVLALAAAACTLLAVGFWAQPWQRREPEVSALRLVDGAELPTRLAAGNRFRALQVSDGSWLTLAAGAKLEVLESSGHVFRSAVRSGRVRFDVRPNGPRRWYVECGLLTVEVVGTSFEVDRREREVTVQVLHGAVLAYGQGVPDRVQRVTAGQTLAITTKAAPPREAASALPEVAGDAHDTPVASAPAQADHGALLRAAAKRGDWTRAWKAMRAIGVEPVVRNARSVDELLLLADVARLAGQPQASALPLERIVHDYASDPRSSLAAFTLATLRLNVLGEPGRAAIEFTRALESGLPRALQQDAWARLVEAHARAGDLTRARAAAADYRARFPDGTRMREVETWAAGR